MKLDFHHLNKVMTILISVISILILVGRYSYFHYNACTCTHRRTILYNTLAPIKFLASLLRIGVFTNIDTK